MISKKKTMFIAIFVVLMCAFTVFGISRHTKTNAPTRFSIVINEGEILTKTISCYDPDGDSVSITVEDLPTGATVGPQVSQPGTYSDPDLPPVPADAPNAKWFTRDLTWTPNYQQAGIYTIYINAKDPSGDEDWVKYVITVNNTNRPPVL